MRIGRTAALRRFAEAVAEVGGEVNIGGYGAAPPGVATPLVGPTGICKEARSSKKQANERETLPERQRPLVERTEMKTMPRTSAENARSKLNARATVENDTPRT